MPIEITSHGDWEPTKRFLSFILRGRQYAFLDSYAQRGVEALRAATPVDTGMAASSWSYEIEKSAKGVRIDWLNSDTESGFQVAIALQYGHGTGTGGFVAGEDYINPAIRPIFDEIANSVWRAVTSA
jgi:hypothetical protein